MNKVDIIIPCWNNHDFTQKCLQSIRMQTKQPYRLILVDNGSHPAVGLMHTLCKDWIVIRNDINLGFAKAVNQGLKASDKSAYKVVLNNDTEVPAGWLEKMCKVAEDKRTGMVGALSSSFTEPHYYKNAERIKALSEIRKVYFHCVLIKPEVIDAIGYLDEGFEFAYCEDDDYCQRATDMKFMLTYAYDVVVKHHHMASTKLLPNIGEIYEKNLARLIEKHPQLERKPKKLHIAVPTAAAVSPYFARTIPQVLFNPKYRISYDFYTQSPVEVNRNYIVKRFLETDGNILCMIDSDIVPPIDFLSAADLDLDVLSLSCLNMVTGSKGREAPHFIYCVADKDEKGDYMGLPPHRMQGIQKVSRVGMGCVFIKREVLEGIEPPWFKQDYDEDFALTTSEDYYFCDKAAEKGFSIWYDFTHICDHRKNNISLLEIMQLIQRERALAIIDYKNRDTVKRRGIIRPN